MDFAKAIRICRSAHGLTQSELAKRVGISPSQVSLIESGGRQPSAEVLKDVSRVLNVPLPLLTLLGSEAEDLSGVQGEKEIGDLAKTLLNLLVHVGQPTHRRPKKRVRRRAS